jgi:hypothetical protein
VPLVAVRAPTTTSSAINARQLVASISRSTGIRPREGPRTRCRRPIAPMRRRLADGRGVTTLDWHIGERRVARLVTIAGLPHAWSGGDDRFAYNDARPPDATALLGEFVAGTVQ